MVSDLSKVTQEVVEAGFEPKESASKAWVLLLEMSPSIDKGRGAADELMVGTW